MKLKLILFCVLLFSSKIVDSNPHSEGHLRQRVNHPSIWQGNQNTQDAEYPDTDFTQTRKVNTLTNPAIQQESLQDYNQGRHNYDGYSYNKSPASSSSGKELLESYNLQTDGRRLESYPPREESYPPRAESYPPRVESYPSEVGFDNKPFRKQNRRPQNLYSNSVPSAVLIADNERPLVNTVQEPYRAPVQYLQPKYVPSSNERFYQPDRSYLTREQFQYPLANNAGDSYVENSRPRYGSSGPVPHESYSEGQARASEIKTKITDGQRYLHNLAPQSGNHNEIPVVATDSLTDQSENIKYLENYRSRSDLSNIASSNSYVDSSPVVENYRIDSRSSNVPESHERFLSGERRHTQSFAPQSGITYNESPAVIIRDTLEDQFKNIKSVENYRSRSDLSNTASSTRYVDSSPVVENYKLDSRSRNVPESHERLSVERRHTQNFAPQSEIIYNESPDTLEDQFKNIKSVENYRSSSDLSETVPTTNYNDDSPVKSAAHNYNLHSSPNNGPGSYESYSDAQAAVSEVKPRPIEAKTIYNDNPALIAIDILADQSTNIRYKKRENPFRSTINNDDDSTVITILETHNDGSRPINNPVPHTKYENSQTALSEERPGPIESQNLQKVAPQPRIIYNDVPTVITTDVLAEQSNNNRYEKREDYKSRPDLSNIAPGTNQDDSSPLTSIVDNSDSKPSNPVPEIVEKRSPLDVNNVLSDRPLARSYAHNYRPATGTSSTVFENSFNDAPNVISETVEKKSGVNEDNYGQNEPIPINSETSPISTHTVQTFQNINKIVESDVPSYESRNPSNNPHHHKIKELNLNKFNIQKHMDGSSKPYLVIHPNGTFEQLDTIDLDSQQNTYLRLVNTKRINVGDTEGDETPLPADTQPALTADQSNSKPPHVKQLADGDNLKPVTPLVNQPVDDDNSKLPLFNQQEDNDKFKPLRTLIRHRLHHHNSKPTDVNQLAFENKSNPSIQDGNLLAVDKSKPQNLNENQSDDNDFNLSSPDENQPSGVNNANLPLTENQPEDDKNSPPLSHPYKRWPHIHHHKSKLSNDNQPTKNNDSNSSLNENQPLDDNNYKILPLNEKQPIEDKKSANRDSQILNLHKRKLDRHYTSKQTHLNQPRDVEIVSLSPSKNNLADDNDSNSSSPVNNKSTDDNHSEVPNESQPGNKLKPIHPHHPVHHNKPKHTHGHQPKHDKNKPENDKNSSLSSLAENKSTDDDIVSTNTSEEEIKSKRLNSPKRPLALHNKLKLLQKDQLESDKNSSQNKSEDDKIPKSSSLDENKSTDDDNFPTNKPEEDIKSKPLSPPERQSALPNESKLSQKDQSEVDEISLQNKSEDDNNSNLRSPRNKQSTDDDTSGNKPEEDIKSKPLSPPERQSALPNESKLSQKDQSEIDEISLQNKSEDDNNSNLRSQRNKQSTDDDTSENKPKDNNKSKPLSLHKGKLTHHNEPKLSHEDKSENVKDFFKDKPGGDDNSNSSSPVDDEPIDDDTFFESQQQNNKEIKPIHQHYRKRAHHNEPKQSSEDQSENDDTSAQNQPDDDDDSNSWIPDDNESIEDDFLENQSEEDDTYPQNNPEDDIDSDSLLAGENEPGQNKKTKPLHKSKRQPTVSKTDEQPVSTTLSSAAPNYTKSPKPQVSKKHKHKHISQKSATTPMIVTTPCPDETSKDQIITLSPIEQVTDNVSDIPPVTTTTTTAKPIKSRGKSKKQKNRVKSSSDDFASITDKVRKHTKASTSSLTTSPGDDKTTSDDKTTKGTVLNKKTDNKVESQVNNVKNDTQAIQSAVYDSSELLDTNTDVLAESDDNSPVTKSPSVQSDVNKSDTSGANTLEFKQPETDIIITVSSSTDNDFEDDIITINVEVFESPGLFSNNKSILVNIDTNNDGDDDSETPLPSDCEKPHNDKEDGRGKNLEIDVSNLKGEPTMWIRTTNQDFIDKLINKNDTMYDMIYFFNLVTQPAVEREKLTTIHCNGTVVIETKEITYARKDDPTPTIVKTTETLQIEDYKRYGQDSLND